MFTVSARRGGWGVGGEGRGGIIAKVYREEAFDTKVSSVVASTTSLGRQIQSLVVLGKNEALLFCFLTVMSLTACRVLGGGVGGGGELCLEDGAMD